ncbi:MAG TPA: MFS transporter, partial [Ideonella sp.]|nr:MFS transporter [Ideonella sp.]
GQTAPRLGLHGIADALRAAPGLMAAGAVGGFFEAGMSGVLPLYGLAAGFGAAMAALLVSAIGLGSTLTMLPIGELADRWSTRRVLLGCAAINLGATLLLPLVPAWPPLAAVIAFLWGGAGGALYTLSMVDIGHRHQGVALVNTTAVLVLAYTLGGMLAPALGGLALNLAPGWGLPLLLAAAAAAGLAVLARR